MIYRYFRGTPKNGYMFKNVDIFCMFYICLYVHIYLLKEIDIDKIILIDLRQTLIYTITFS